MTGTLKSYDGKLFPLPVLTQYTVDTGDKEGCGSFYLRFAWDQAAAELLGQAAEFTAVEAGKTVFTRRSGRGAAGAGPAGAGRRGDWQKLAGQTAGQPGGGNGVFDGPSGGHSVAVCQALWGEQNCGRRPAAADRLSGGDGVQRVAGATRVLPSQRGSGAQNAT